MNFSGFGCAYWWCANRGHLRRTLEFSLLHGVAVILTWYVIYPVQTALVGDNFNDAISIVPILLFLPAVVKAIAAWMHGWWAVIYIFPTATLQPFIMGAQIDAAILLKLSVYLLSAPIIRNCLILLSVVAGAKYRSLRTWRSLVVIVILSSFAAGSCFSFIGRDDVILTELVLFVFLFLLGDVAGAFAVLAALALFFRIRRRIRTATSVRSEV